MSYIDPQAEIEEIRRLGEVSEPQDRPPVDPFSGSQEPFPLDPADFKEAVEIADALIEGTPQGEVIWDFSGPGLRPCPYCHSWAFTDADADDHFDAAQCICKE